MDFNDFYQKNVNIFGFAPFCKLLKERNCTEQGNSSKR